MRSGSAPQDVRQLWDALLAAGAAPVGSEALELHRIVSGIPRYGVDIRERDLPQETEQARALNFNKGCYVGQEIVERIRSRGAVHRKFTGFLAEGAAQIAPGSKIVAGEKEVGEITSAASLQLQERDKTVALGYIRREVGMPGREVTIGACEGDGGAVAGQRQRACRKIVRWSSIRREEQGSAAGRRSLQSAVGSLAPFRGRHPEAPRFHQRGESLP